MNLKSNQGWWRECAGAKEREAERGRGKMVQERIGLTVGGDATLQKTLKRHHGEEKEKTKKRSVVEGRGKGADNGSNMLEQHLRCDFSCRSS